MSPDAIDNYQELLINVEEFANEFVGNKFYRRNSPPKKPKIIHDPLWGTILLHPWEVALLDLPLFQRLRQVCQTSLVSLVFPGCNHTRFEHTLGVIKQTQRLVDAVNCQRPLNEGFYSFEAIRNLRLAALFHDCGHSCFSHISEELYADCPDMVALKKNPDFPKCNPHEALSALILMSKPVSEYLKELEDYYRIRFDVKRAAYWIMGTSPPGEERRRYETEVINGPFDADKLDYIFRDSYYSGIPLGVDLYRLWATCEVSRNNSSGDDVLTLHQSSVTPLEQILFNKINLFSIVYQHPKVRAAERMFHSVIEKIQSSDGSDAFVVSGRRFNLNRAADFLWMTDETFFSEALRRESDDPVHKKIHAIRYRRLLVRALTISKDTLAKDVSGFQQFRKLNQLGENTFIAKRKLAQQIVDNARVDVDVEDVWLDIPSDPKFGEADRTYVRTAGDHLRKLTELFPVNYWSELFQKYKWRAHVFCPENVQQKIYESALEVLKDQFGMRFKKSAGESSHVPNPCDSL